MQYDSTIDLVSVSQMSRNCLPNGASSCPTIVDDDAGVFQLTDKGRAILESQFS